MTKNKKILAVILISVPLVFKYGDRVRSFDWQSWIPNIIPSVPVSQEVRTIADEIISKGGVLNKKDTMILGKSFQAVSNLWAIDGTGKDRKYVSEEDYKNSMWRLLKESYRISYPIGFKMADKYPALAKVLADVFTKRLGEEDYKASDIILLTRTVGEALEVASKEVK